MRQLKLRFTDTGKEEVLFEWTMLYRGDFWAELKNPELANQLKELGLRLFGVPLEPPSRCGHGHRGDAMRAEAPISPVQAARFEVQSLEEQRARGPVTSELEQALKKARETLDREVRQQAAQWLDMKVASGLQQQLEQELVEIHGKAIRANEAERAELERAAATLREQILEHIARTAAGQGVGIGLVVAS